ncbi:MAG TPA: hypothetical protein VIE88_11780 [Vicinamibacteria bacterium]|jgi:disulfide bond formation protein DsbB
MQRRGWIAIVATLAAALVLVLAFPHGHVEGTRNAAKDDCVLCHAQRAPVVDSGIAVAIPDVAVSLHCDEIADGEEREAVLGRRPSRAPPS